MSPAGLFATLALATSAAPSPPPALASALRDYDAAQVSGSERELQRLIADDYLLVNSAGESESKEQFIRDLTAPGYHLDPFVVRQPFLREWKGGAVAGGTTLLRGVDGGRAFEACLRFADVWSLRGGRWLLVFTQASRAEIRACAATAER